MIKNFPFLMGVLIKYEYAFLKTHNAVCIYLRFMHLSYIIINQQSEERAELRCRFLKRGRSHQPTSTAGASSDVCLYGHSPHSTPGAPLAYDKKNYSDNHRIHLDFSVLLNISLPCFSFKIAGSSKYSKKPYSIAFTAGSLKNCWLSNICWEFT